MDLNAATVAAARLNRPHLYVASADKVDDDTTLGQYIPIHYHYQLLATEDRMAAFRDAINLTVKPGMKVLELGGGTGVLSYFAAQAGASKVYCVERVPNVAKAAQRFALTNNVSDRVEVIQGDANDYLPPEPVDVVVCEMLHPAMLREKQLPIIASFKKRYTERFGAKLPRFLPEAAVMAVQVVNASFDFGGFNAAVPLFLAGQGNGGRANRLARPMLYSMFEYRDAFATRFNVDHMIAVENPGTLNALRFITKNLIAIDVDNKRSIDWDMNDLVVPLTTPLTVNSGDLVRVRFRYDAGDSIQALAESIDGQDIDTP